MQEEIEEKQIPKKDVAEALDILPHHLSDIFAGKRNISARLAVKPGKVLGIKPQYWFILKLEYGLYIAMQGEARV